MGNRWGNSGNSVRLYYYYLLYSIVLVLPYINMHIFLGSKITADGDCSHEIKRCLEELPHFQGPVAAWVQEGLEELLHPEGQEGWQ